MGEKDFRALKAEFMKELNKPFEESLLKARARSGFGNVPLSPIDLLELKQIYLQAQVGENQRTSVGKL